MNKENIIFLGIINSAEEFYEITGKNFFELKQQEFNEDPAIYNDKQGNLFWNLEENKKPLETLHHTSDVFSKGNNSII